MSHVTILTSPCKYQKFFDLGVVFLLSCTFCLYLVPEGHRRLSFGTSRRGCRSDAWRRVWSRPNRGRSPVTRGCAVEGSYGVRRNFTTAIMDVRPHYHRPSSFRGSKSGPPSVPCRGLWNTSLEPKRRDRSFLWSFNDLRGEVLSGPYPQNFINSVVL